MGGPAPRSCAVMAPRFPQQLAPILTPPSSPESAIGIRNSCRVTSGDGLVVQADYNDVVPHARSATAPSAPIGLPASCN